MRNSGLVYSLTLSSMEFSGSLALEIGTRTTLMSVSTRLEGISANKAGPFAVVLEVYEVAPSLFMVDVRKAAGDTLEYHKFYKQMCSKLDQIIWKPTGSKPHSSLSQTVPS